MKYSVSITCQILDVNKNQLTRWASIFRDNLSASANPKPGTERFYTPVDVLVLLYVSYYWEREADIKAIVSGLASGGHLDDLYVHTLWNYTPLIRDEAPEDMDEPSRYGLLISPQIHLKRIEIARSYHRAANVLWDKANDSGNPFEDCYPVFFAYRHALELYLKMLGNAGEGHNLEKLMKKMEKHQVKEIPPLFRKWILTLHRMDETGWYFRYEPNTEGTMDGQWLDWTHFRYAMDTLFNALDSVWLNINR